MSSALQNLLSSPSAAESLRVVAAGQTIAYKMHGSNQGADTMYRLSSDSLRSMLPCMKVQGGRVVVLSYEAFLKLLEEGWMDLIPELERMSIGCCVCVLEDNTMAAGYDPSCAAVVWRGRRSAKLWINEDLASTLHQILSEPTF